MAFGQDLSKQRYPPFNIQVEQELHIAKSLLDRAIDAIFWVAPNARFIYVNDMACRWLGYSREELLCLSVYDVAPDLSVEVWSQQWRSLQQDGCLTFESQYKTKAGEFLPVEVSVTYGLIQDQEFGCAFARARRQEVELNRVLEQEKKCSQLRAEFICMLSHEIRMSLHLISFSTTFLKRHSDRWDWEKKQSYLDCVQTAVEQIDQFLDDVLLIGKVEAGKLRFDPEPLDLHQLCCDLVTQMQLLSHRSQHTIVFVSRGNCKTPFVDRKLLRPILTNLLDNAIKYSPPGSTVNLELTCQDDNLIFHIKDAGIGIPATDRQKLFEPFHRGSNVGEVSGTGLGLTVVKKLVDLQGGQITVATEIGSGTTFTIALPLLKEKESEDRIQNNSTNELLGLQ